MKTTVLYHSADFDGIFCREIARKFLPDAELIGWNHGDLKIPVPKEGPIYILDLSPECLAETPGGETVPHYDRMIWIDHHKSSIDKFPSNIPGYRIDGVAACRLAWQWFTKGLEPKWNGENGDRLKNPNLPTDVQFKNREVSEPLAVRLAGEYDIWDKRDPNAEIFQHGLRSRELTDWDWRILLGTFRKPSIKEIESMMDVGHPFDLKPDGTCDESVATVKGLLRNGEMLQWVRAQENASIIKELGFTFQWEGFTWLACNHARYNSHIFTAALRPEHDACFGFKFTGHVAAGKPSEEWSVSLYHAPGKEHHDLSKIAVKYGGGGHRGAAGMIMQTLPFIQNH